MSRESVIVLGGMIAVVVVLIGARVAYEDIAAWIGEPSAEEAAAGEQAIDELERVTESSDPEDLVAAVAPCAPGRDYNEACVTVTPKWGTARNRQEVATTIWKNWATICTQHELAEDPKECFIHLRSGAGEALGGSGEEDGSRIWVRE